MIRSLVDEVLEQRATRLAWYVRRTWTNNIEVLLKEKTEYTGVDTLVALKDLQTKLHGKFDLFHVDKYDSFRVNTTFH